MKKVLTIALLVLLCAGFVFAETKDLTVKLKIEEINTPKWFSEEPANVRDFDVTDGSKEITSKDLVTGDEGVTVYPAVKTNYKGAMEMKITGNPLYSDTTGEYITIKASGDSQEVTWENGSSEGSISYQETGTPSGIRVFSDALTLKVDGTSYDEASAADDYTATITLTTSAV